MVSCKVCGNTNFKPYLIPRLELDLIACSCCNHVVLNTGSDASEYISSMEGQFFSDEYIDTHDWYDRWLSRHHAARRMRQITRQRKNGHLLDIGPGTGELIAAAKRRGFTCYAIDLSEALVRHVGSTLGVEARAGSFQDLPSWGRTFDVVVMSHVLEHCDNPVESLKYVKTVVHPDSLIHIAVPNLASWPARFSGWKPFVPYHLHYFTPDTLKHVLNLAGFEIVKMSTFQDGPAWPNSLARSALQRVGSRSPASAQGPTSTRMRSKAYSDIWNAFTIVVGYGLIPLRWIQTRLMQGDELVVVARPSLNPEDDQKVVALGERSSNAMNVLAERSDA